MNRISQLFAIGLLLSSGAVSARDCPPGDDRCNANQKRSEGVPQTPQKPTHDTPSQQPAPATESPQVGGASRWNPEKEADDAAKTKKPRERAIGVQH